MSLQSIDRDSKARMRRATAAAEAERAAGSARFRVGARVVVDIMPEPVCGRVVACESNPVAGTVVTVAFDSGEQRRLVAARVKLDRAGRAS